MSHSWSIPQFLFQNTPIATVAGYTQSGTINLNNTYTDHFVAFTGSSPSAGTEFILTLYGFQPDEMPGDGPPYAAGSITSTTTHKTGGWQAGYNNVGSFLVKDVPAAFLFADVYLVSGGTVNLSASVISANL